jgi:hypothetical protein
MKLPNYSKTLHFRRPEVWKPEHRLGECKANIKAAVARVLLGFRGLRPSGHGFLALFHRVFSRYLATWVLAYGVWARRYGEVFHERGEVSEGAA